jgi:hypothetical protein
MNKHLSTDAPPTLYRVVEDPMAELPAIEGLLSRNRDRLQGVNGWADVERLGRTNVERLRELLAEDACAALAADVTAAERREWTRAAEALATLAGRAVEAKPCLPRFRVESFRAGAAVQLYAGDTPGSLVPGWVGGRVVAVTKAHRPDWNDGSPNAGYFWQVDIAPERAVLADGGRLSCSTSEPRVLHADDYRFLREAVDADPEFFRIFADNAQRSWIPLWCLQRGLGLAGPEVRVRDWFPRR